MSVNYSNAAASNRLSAGLLAASVTPAAGQSVDSNSGNGQLVIGTSALSGATGVLATITLQKPSFTISGKIATLAGTPLSATATAAGTAALAELRDSAGNTIVSGLTVGVSGTDLTIAATSIAPGETVTITSGTITHP